MEINQKIEEARELVKSDLGRADSMSQALLKHPEVQKNDSLKAKVFHLHGVVSYYKDQYRLSNYYYRKSLKTEYGKHNEELKAKNLNNMAINFELQRRYDSAYLRYKESLAIEKEQNDTLGIGQSLLNLGLLEIKLSNYAKSDSLTRLALGYFEKMGDILHIAKCYQNLGFKENRKGNYHKAIPHYRKALRKFREAEYMNGVSQTYSNLVKEYINKGQFSNALNTIDTLEQVLQNYPSPSMKLTRKLAEAEVYNRLENPDKVAPILDELKGNKEQLARYQLLQPYYRERLNMLGLTGRWEEYRQTLEKFLSREDSLQQAQQQQHVEELKVLHQVDKQNALLAKKDKVIAFKTSRNRILIIAIGILLVMLVSVLYLYLRNKRLWQIITHLNLYSRLSIKRLQTKKTNEQGKKANGENGMEELFRKIDALVKEDEWYKDKNLSIKMLARELASNELYVSRAINTCSGMNFNTYVNNFRVEMAKQLLLAKSDNNSFSLAEIGYEVGFSTPASFSRTFKNLTGLSPSGFYELNNQNAVKSS